jgi:hypothetical protein
MFKDPANIFVVVIMVGMVAFMIAAKINSDKLEKEEQQEKAKKRDAK